MKKTIAALSYAPALAFLMTVSHALADASSKPSRAEIGAAIQACATENNIAPPSPGQRPTEAERKVIGDCMTAKGFAPPPDRGQGGHRHHHQDSTQEAESSTVE